MNIRLHEKYNKEITKNLKDKFKYKNNLEIPKLLKVVINKYVKKKNEPIKPILKDSILIFMISIVCEYIYTNFKSIFELEYIIIEVIFYISFFCINYISFIFLTRFI